MGGGRVEGEGVMEEEECGQEVGRRNGGESMKSRWEVFDVDGSTYLFAFVSRFLFRLRTS